MPHSLMDLHGMFTIDEIFKNKAKFDQGIGLKDSALCLYKGNTVFSIFASQDSEKKLEKIIKNLFPQSEAALQGDEENREFEIRRLYRVLTTLSPAVNFTNPKDTKVKKLKGRCVCEKPWRQIITRKENQNLDTASVYSALERTIFLNSKSMRDKFMTLLQESNELKISDFAYD